MPEDLEIAPWLPPESPPMAEAMPAPVPQPGRRMTGYAETYVPAPDLEGPEMQLKRNAAIADIYANSRNFQEAEQAVVSAIRWMEFRQIEKDIREGVPAELAYARHPRAALTMGDKAPSSVIPDYLRALKPPPTLRTETAGGQNFALFGNNMRMLPAAAQPPGPLQASPLIGPDGKPMADFVSVPGAGGRNVPLRVPSTKPPATNTAIQSREVKAEGMRAVLKAKRASGVMPDEADIDKLRAVDAEIKALQSANNVPRAQAPPPVESKPLTEAVAREFLKQAGGDKEKARALARKAGYDF